MPARRKPIAHTPRSKALLESRGWTVERTEHWVSLERGTGKTCGACGQETKQESKGPPGVRKDLFGLADLMALKEGEPHMWIQVLSLSTWSQHWQKATRSSALLLWLKTGGRFQFHCWRKIMVGKAERWFCLVREVVLKGPNMLSIVETDLASAKKVDRIPEEELLFV